MHTLVVLHLQTFICPLGEISAHALRTKLQHPPEDSLKASKMNKRTNAKCPNWIEFIDSFPQLDQDAIREFLRRCINPELPSRFLVVHYDHDRVRGSLEDMLSFLLPMKISSSKRYSLMKKSEPYQVTILDGIPTTQSLCNGLRKNLVGNKSRVIAFTQKMYRAPLPPHLFADFRNQQTEMNEVDDFRDQIEGICEWANSKPLPRPKNHVWTGTESIVT